MPEKSVSVGKTALLQFLVVLIPLLAAVGVSVTYKDTGVESSVPPVVVPTSGVPVPPVPGNPSAAGCVRPEGMNGLIDQDTSDSQKPWKRPAGQKAVINVDARTVANNSEALGYLNAAAKKWNVSPCVDLRILTTACPSGSNCVQFGLGGSDDGNFDSIEKNGYTVGGKVTVSTKLKGSPLVNGEGKCSEKYNVAVHELGHVIGLVHRKTEHVLMNGDTYNDVCDPDETDFKNLRWSYTALQK